MNFYKFNLPFPAFVKFLTFIFFSFQLSLQAPSFSQSNQPTQSPNDLFTAGKVNSAILAWTQLINRGIDLYPSLYNRAQAYIVTKQFKLALADLNMLEIKRRPYVDPQVLSLKGVVLNELGDYNQALQSLNLSLKLSKTAYSLTNRAVIYQKLGNLPKAELDFHAASIMVPSYSNFYNLASLQLSQKKYSECSINANKALTLITSPFYPGYTTRGICSYHLTHYEDSIADLLRSASINQYQPEAYLFLGLALLKVNRSAEAKSYLLKSADIFLEQSKQPEYQEVMKTLASIP